VLTTVTLPGSAIASAIWCAFRRSLCAPVPRRSKRTVRLARPRRLEAPGPAADPPRPVRRRPGGRGRAAPGTRRDRDPLGQASAGRRLRDHGRPGRQPHLRHRHGAVTEASRSEEAQLPVSDEWADLMAAPEVVEPIVDSLWDERHDSITTREESWRTQDPVSSLLRRRRTSSRWSPG